MEFPFVVTGVHTWENYGFLNIELFTNIPVRLYLAYDFGYAEPFPIFKKVRGQVLQCGINFRMKVLFCVREENDQVTNHHVWRVTRPPSGTPFVWYASSSPVCNKALPHYPTTPPMPMYLKRQPDANDDVYFFLRHDQSFPPGDWHPVAWDDVLPFLGGWDYNLGSGAQLYNYCDWDVYTQAGGRFFGQQTPFYRNITFEMRVLNLRTGLNFLYSTKVINTRGALGDQAIFGNFWSIESDRFQVQVKHNDFAPILLSAYPPNFNRWWTHHPTA